MGNSSKRPEEYDIVRNYRKQDWVQYLRTNSFQLWKHKFTHQTVEVYRLYEVPSPEDLARYEWRASQQDLVKVYHIAVDLNQNICTKSEYVQLLIEHLPIRLYSIGNLDLEEALTLLTAALRAFNSIENRFEPVEPNEELIGFNEAGRPKVWLNKKLNVNFPDHAYMLPYQNNQQQISSRVRKIFDMVQQRTHNGALPIYLKDQFRKKSPNYNQALSIIQDFAFKEHLSLRRYLRTDLLSRRTSTFQHQQPQPTTIKTHVKNKSNFTEHPVLIEQTAPQNGLKKIFSVGALNNNQILKTSAFHNIMPNQQPLPLRQNNLIVKTSFMSNTSNSNPTYRSIPKINFVKTNEPITLINNLCSTQNNQIRSITVSRENLSPRKIIPIHHVQTQNIGPIRQLIIGDGKPQINFVIKNNKEVQQPPPVVQQVIAPAVVVEVPVVIQQHQQEIEQNRTIVVQKEQTKQIQGQTQIVAKSELQQSPSLPLKVDTKKSIIDKVVDQNSKSLHSDSDGQASIRQDLQNHLQIQTSGTFKPINDNQIKIDEPAEISSQQNCYSQQNMENPIQIQNIGAIPQLPINFQSFAPNLQNISLNQFVSFAPHQVHTNPDNAEQNAAATCKSVELQQNQQHQLQNLQTSPKLVESGQQKLFDSYGEEQANQLVNRHDYRYEQSQQEQPRVSIQNKQHQQQIHNQQIADPFYASYTPVQSKFDVVVKRDSMMSQDSRERKERPSAFAHLQDDDIQKYVREKYDSYINSSKGYNYMGEVKVGRVSSQYETHSIMTHQFSKHMEKEKEDVKLQKYQIQKKKSIKQQPKLMKLHSKPYQTTNVPNITEKNQEDFLDVNFLQKSLDKKYCSLLKKPSNSQHSIKEEDDQLNIAKLEQGLLKFSSSQLSLNNTDKRKSQTQQITQKQLQQADQKFMKGLNLAKNSSNDYYSNYLSKYQPSTQFESNEPIKSVKTDKQKLLKKKKSVRISVAPAIQFNYQLSATDYAKFGVNSNPSPAVSSGYRTDQFKSSSYQTDFLYKYRPKQPEGLTKYGSEQMTRRNQKRSSKISQQASNKLDQKYSKYVKNANSNKITRANAKANESESNKQSIYKQRVSRQAERGQKLQHRISYDQLKSYLWN